jgi:uncharacterized Fe-S cluster-containing radical SAM superfamily protein
MLEKAKLPCPAVLRNSELKENNRCSFFKKSAINQKHNFTTQIHASKYLENKKHFLPALSGCLDDKHRKKGLGLHISNLHHTSMVYCREYETVSWYVPQDSEK